MLVSPALLRAQHEDQEAQDRAALAVAMTDPATAKIVRHHKMRRLVEDAIVGTVPASAVLDAISALGEARAARNSVRQARPDAREGASQQRWSQGAA